MKYKVLLLALAAITTSCSPQADINYQIIPEQPQQTMDHFSASEHAHHRQMASGETGPSS